MANTKAKPKPPIVEDTPPRRRKAKASSSVVAPDLTPMIDVTFQLLIYFLVTSAFIPDEGQIPGSLPSKSVSQSESPLKPIELQVGPAVDGEMKRIARYTIKSSQKTTTDANDLFKLLASSHQKGDDVPLIIQVQDMVRGEFVVEAFNQGTRAHYKKIGFKN